MRYKLVSAAAAAAIAISLLAAPGASAATEAGSKCVADTIESSDFTQIELAKAPSGPLPTTIPIDGVITRWTFDVVSIPAGSQTQTLKVFRPTSTPNAFQVIGESAPGDLGSGGLSTFATRIPVRAGDIIGSHGSTPGGEPTTIYCNGVEGGYDGFLAGNPPVGSIARIEDAGYHLQLPITVSVEPDADYDGFGDETQDACPQLAAFQTACPPLVLSAVGQVKKGAVIVIATAGAAVPISVKGVVSLGKNREAVLDGGTQSLGPGILGWFKLKLTKQVKTRLAGLSRKKSLTLSATVAGANVAGAVTTQVLKVKLRGLRRS
jgi:hypothetical protein